MPLDFRRRETAKAMLDIVWGHPVYAPDLGEQQRPVGGTSTGSQFSALPREKALLEINPTGDRRPMLILRECDKCKGSDAALLSRKLDNEKTVLLTHWFHCVKLPNDVLDAKHPFRNLFDSEHPPHVFLCDPDGSNVIEFDGNQSPRFLWAAMHSVLERYYSGDAEAALKSLRRLLDEFDEVDIREDELRGRLDDELVKRGAESPKVEKLKKQIEAVQAERRKLEEKKQRLLDLGLREAAKADAK